jgi:transcriptional regulator with GAF, ATPase, and Fis domain
MATNPHEIEKAVKKVEKLIEDKKIPLTKATEIPVRDLLDKCSEFIKSGVSDTASGPGRYKALFEIASSLSSYTDPFLVTQTILDETIKHLKCERGMIVEVTDDGSVAIRLSRGVGDDEASDISHTMVVEAVDAGEGIFYDSAQGVGTESLIQRKVTSGITQPFLIEKGRHGVIYIDTRDPAIHLGEDDLKFLGKVAELAGSALSAAIQVNRQMDEGQSGAFGTVIGSSASMRMACQRARRVARTDENVLLLGESGTGKEIFARAIHDESKRAKGPFEAINCSAIPDELLESELFGYLEGAFTGAKKGGKPGIFELSEKGTLFLDEIGDMPPLLQSKLLRVLQERKIRRVGGTSDVPVNVRIIAATHQDLDKCMADGTFREDLYYRLSTFPIQLPPLRDRGNDILELADFLLEKFTKEYGVAKPSLSPKATYYFLEYPWKGNIREMENVLKRILIDHEPRVIHPKHLPPEMVDAKSSALADFPTLEELEHQHVLKALNLVNGNRGKAATLLEISEATLYRWIADMKKKGVMAED